jgi:hypothetical protein
MKNSIKVGDKVLYNSVMGYPIRCVVIVLGKVMATVKEPVTGKMYFCRLERLDPIHDN